MQILGSLREGFHQTFFQRTPYLYPDLEDVSAEDEQAPIDRGEIRSAGFRFVGNLVRDSDFRAATEPTTTKGC